MTYIPSNKIGINDNFDSRFIKVNSISDSIQLVKDAKTKRILEIEFEH